MPRIDAFLKLGSSQGCSDVHLAVGVPPMLRMNGDLVPIETDAGQFVDDRGVRGSEMASRLCGHAEPWAGLRKDKTKRR